MLPSQTKYYEFKKTFYYAFASSQWERNSWSVNWFLCAPSSLLVALFTERVERGKEHHCLLFHDVKRFKRWNITNSRRELNNKNALSQISLNPRMKSHHNFSQTIQIFFFSTYTHKKRVKLVWVIAFVEFQKIHHSHVLTVLFLKIVIEFQSWCFLRGLQPTRFFFSHSFRFN